MSISINFNVGSVKASRQIDAKNSAVNKTFEKLSSGKEINRASDNPAGLAIALDLLSQADTGAVAARNISDGASALNIADGALSSAGDITARLSELATQASNGTLTDSQRSALNNEFQTLKSELDRISQTTQFNGQSLLSQDSSIGIQAGTTGTATSQLSVALPGVSSSSLGLTSDISTQAGAQAALDQAKSAVQSISSARAEIGAGTARLDTAFENLKTNEINNRDAASRIMDADVAQQSANLVANKISLQAAVAVKAQANLAPQIALQLLG